MSRLVFGRDRIPEPWIAPKTPPECRAGEHLVDAILERCTVCFWLDPEIERCSTQGCIYPADYEAEVAARDDPAFTNVLRSALFCRQHFLLGGIALVPDRPVA